MGGGTALWHHEPASRELSHLSQGWSRQLGAWQGRGLGGSDNGGNQIVEDTVRQEQRAQKTMQHILHSPKILTFQRSSGIGEGEMKERPWSRNLLQCFEFEELWGLSPLLW